MLASGSKTKQLYSVAVLWSSSAALKHSPWQPGLILAEARQDKQQAGKFLQTYEMQMLCHAVAWRDAMRFVL